MGSRCQNWALIGLGALLLLSLACPAQAVINLRNLGYSTVQLNPYPIPRDVHPPADLATSVSFLFDADITATDRNPAGGITFYITERDAGQGDGDQLYHFVLVPGLPLPPVGTQVHIYVEATFYCDALGRLRPYGTATTGFSWCDGSGPQFTGASGVGRGDLPEFSEPEAFELVVQDENLHDAPVATVEDVLVCRDAAHGALTVLGNLQAPAVAKAFASAPGRVESESPGTIGVYFDALGQTCSATIRPFVPFTVWLMVLRSGITNCGITGAEFRLEGLPGSFFANVNALGGAFVIGSPTADGTNIFWSACQAGPNPFAPLFRLDVLPTTQVQDLALNVKAKNPTTNLLWTAPIVTLCDGPAFTAVVVDAGSGVLNPSSTPPCQQTVAVQPATWSYMKELYRR